MLPLQAALEDAGHTVTVCSESTLPTSTTENSTDAIVLDGGALDCAAVVKAWRNTENPPAVLIMGQTNAAKKRAHSCHCHFLDFTATPEAARDAIERILPMRYAGRMSRTYARSVLNLGKAGDPASDAIRIVTNARTVDVALVRECLRWHIHDYVGTTNLLTTLQEYRALLVPEIELIKRMDGTQTVQRLVSAESGDGVLAGRLLWALLSAGVATCTKEPPDESTPARRAVTAARRHLRARELRTQNTTHYDILEIDRDANAAQVDYAARTLAVRFSPDRLRAYDLGELAALVSPLWQQILVARQILMDLPDRARYNDYLEANRNQYRDSWAFTVQDISAAEKAFRRGQAALVDGQPFKAVSSIAAACRGYPGHPDYEASLCWARFRAELARGNKRENVIGKERAAAEEALAGRRPWPRALVALALLCSADSDADAARWHLQEALAIDPNLPAARQLLGGLG